MNMFYSYVINSYPAKTISTDRSELHMYEKQETFLHIFSIHLIFLLETYVDLYAACEKTKEFSFIPYTIIACGGNVFNGLIS